MPDTATQTAQPEVAAPESAAPVDGQGGAGGGSGLYDLSQIPEGIRDQVAPVFKDWEGNVTREFQKRADDLKAWEPFDQLGLRDYDPQSIEQLLSFGTEVLADEGSFKEWVKEAAEELGLLGGQTPEAAPQGAPEGDVAAAVAQAAADGQSLTPDSVQKMISDALQQQQQQAEQQRAQEEALEAASTQIRGDLDALKSEHGEFDEDVVLRLALSYDGADAIKQGFADFQRLVGQGERSALAPKVEAPETPNTGGQSVAPAKPPASFEEAAARTREQIRINQST